MSIRSFIAIPVPHEMANLLRDISAKMAYQDKSNAVRWVDQQNYHLSLAFLGEQQEQDLELLAEHLDERLTQSSLPIAIRHLSPFPQGKPKLIAALIEQNLPLQDLHQQVVAALFASRVNADKRRFIPHITLGRYRHNKTQFAGAIPTAVKLFGEITEVSIFQSILTPSGADYHAIFRFPLDEFEYNLQPHEI